MVSDEGTGPWYEELPGARAALEAREVTAVYRLLRRVGFSQRELSRRTGQSQSEVSEILRGRRVQSLAVLERVCDGLEVPRALMRLWSPPEDPAKDPVEGPAQGAAEAYAGSVTDPPEEVDDEEMRRRVLLAHGGIALGQPVPQLAKLRKLIALAAPAPAPGPLPARIEGRQVAQVRHLTRRLGQFSEPAAEPEMLSTDGPSSGHAMTRSNPCVDHSFQKWGLWESSSNPPRRHRTYPRVIKRGRHNSYRIKKTTDIGIRDDGPATIKLANLGANRPAA